MKFRELPFEDRMRIINFHDRALSIESLINNQAGLQMKLQESSGIDEEEFEELYINYVKSIKIKGEKMKTINDLIKNDSNINKEFREMFGESREEILAGDAQSKLSAKLKDMSIEQKWNVISHSSIKKSVLIDYLSGHIFESENTIDKIHDLLNEIIIQHPYIYNEYFGE